MPGYNWDDRALITAIVGDDTLMIQNASETVIGEKMNRIPAAFLLKPDGSMLNGKISVAVASNNLTVSLLTADGSTPSADNPVIVKINGTIRAVTEETTVTKNAGTNWCNAGGAELATKEIDYFVYLIWNTTPATDIIDIGFSRTPFGVKYSDFSATTTNEKYLAYGNASAPTSTDDVVNIGRFAATLSAGAGYTWTVPTFTADNLRQRPTFETRWLDWAANPTGYSAVPTNIIYKYLVDWQGVHLYIREGTAGASNATTMGMSLPFTAKTLTNAVWLGMISADDNSAALTNPGRIVISSAGTTLSANTSFGGGTWTAGGNKRISLGEIRYEF